MKNILGATAIELMITLIVTTILAGISAPKLANWYDVQRAAATIKMIQQTLAFGRNNAISYGNRVTICPVKNNRCDENWDLGLTVFIDSGVINRLDGNDKILLKTANFNPKDTVLYNRTSVRFLPDGLASGSNGTLRYCPTSITSINSKAVIVNQSGRIRFSKSKNIHC